MNKIKQVTDPKSNANKENNPRGKINTNNATTNKTPKGKADKNVPSSPTTEVNPEG